MINWTKTIEIGTKDLNTYRPKIVVSCDKCGKDEIIRVRVKSRIINNQLNWECPKCIGNRPERVDKIKKQMKKQWQNDNYKSDRKNGTIKMWNNDEFRKTHLASVNTPENREHCSIVAKKAWLNPEYRKSHAIGLIKESTRRPSTEIKFDAILESLGIKHKPYIIGPYTFDYGIENNNKILLIEINGNYWHTRPYVIRKDKAKVLYISNLPNYELRTIWEHQLYDTDRIIQLVNLWLGKNTQYKTIELSEVSYCLADPEEVKDFVSNYHYLGSLGRTKTCIMCKYDNKIIGACILAHPTNNSSILRIGMKKNQVLELTRFALSPLYRNKNLASHFLSKIKNFIDKPIKRIISFADPSAGHSGTIYKAANWVTDGETEVSYFYIKEDGWKLHKRTLYRQANSNHMTEQEFATAFGYKKIHVPPLLRFYIDI